MSDTILDACGCCAGIEALTPIGIWNRPGLSALRYRVGTHGSFLETMLARLSTHALQVPTGEVDAQGQPAYATLRPLQALTTRAPGDPAIALLDAWATVADVLSFYQERIANEGYLRTATERRSVLELARLVGYALRPGVAASVYLAYTLEINGRATIAAGSRAQSLADQGQLPQTFETSDDLEARVEWNVLQPRLEQTPYITLDNLDAIDIIYLLGFTANLKPDDRLLFVFGAAAGQQSIRRVASVETQIGILPEESRTIVHLQGAIPNAVAAAGGARTIDILGNVIDALKVPASIPPPSSRDLGRTVRGSFSPGNDTLPQLLIAANPALDERLYAGWASQPAAPSPPLDSLQAFRIKAAPFGSTAPLKPVFSQDDRHVVTGYVEWPIAGTVALAFATSRAIDIPVRISVARSGNTETGSVRPNGDRLVLNGLTITASTETPPGGATGLVVRVDELKRAYTLTPANDGNAYHVTITDADNTTFDGDIGMNDTMQRNSADRNLVITYLERGPIVFDETPLPPSPLNVIALDAQYDQIVPGSWVIVERPGKKPDQRLSIIARVTRTETLTKTDYGMTAKVTQLTLERPWLTKDDRLLSVMRGTTVFAQSEPLDLAPEPIDTPIGACPDDPASAARIELDGLYGGLTCGRWVIVSGERVGAPGVHSSELAMIGGTTHGVQQITDANGNTIDRPGDHTHTFLFLAKPLKYCYVRKTAVVYGNVAHATHGETRPEVLGSGDGSKPLQSFTLRQPPLTYVSAPTVPAGALSTLQVRVNDLLWHEADSLAGLGPTDRRYVLKTDDAQQTTIVFGNGQAGARLPSGIENVRAVYRNGIGKSGNIDAEKINQLATRPRGVKGVVNPMPSTGGANPEDRDQARRNVPRATASLDRLVSVQDYEDFARTYAGIGKGRSTRLSDGRRTVVHLTIAGVDDIPILETSDLYINLREALHRFGDPYQPLQVALRRLKLLIIAADIALLPDYDWDAVEPLIRASVQDTFAFANRELGQDALLSEAIRAIQSVPGVRYVDVGTFDAVPDDITPEPLTQLSDTLTLNDRIVARDAGRIDPPAPDGSRIRPAEIVVLTPAVPDTLILREIKS